MIEILMVLVMSGIMILAALSTISLLDRSSRRQALDTGAMELAQGRIEELQSTKYNPPIAPFYATNWTQTTNVVLLLNKAGTSNLLTAVMKTTVAPVSMGHLVTVKVSTTNADQPLVAQLQTLVNRNSGGQP